MTDNEIIKAYECCSKAKTMHDCELLGCPAKTNQGCSYVLRSDYDKEDCVFFEMLKDFVGIYSLQKTEIERLNDRYEKLYLKYDDVINDNKFLKRKNNEQKAEIERLESVLVGVMHFVDKWLEGEELNQDEVNRASTMREKTLQIVERLEKELRGDSK